MSENSNSSRDSSAVSSVMKCSVAALIAVLPCLAFVVPQTAMADAAGAAPLLLSPAPAPVAATDALRIGAGEQATAVRVDASVVAANPARMSLELGAGEAWVAERLRWHTPAKGRAVWTGTFEVGPAAKARAAAQGPHPNAGVHAARGYALFSYIDERVVGTLETPDGEHYHLGMDSQGRYQLQRIRSAGAHSCALNESWLAAGAEKATTASVADAAALETAASTSGCTVTNTVTIDLMGLYTPYFVGALEQSAQDAIQHNIDVANDLFQQSGVGIYYNLIHTGPVTKMGTLTNFRDPADGDMIGTGQAMNLILSGTAKDEISRLQGDYGADMVSVMLEPRIQADPQNEPCGQATLPYKKGPDQAGEYINDLTLFSDQAYMVYHRGCGLADYTFAHEHAHNLGLWHDRTQAQRDQDVLDQEVAVLPYAYGHLFYDGGHLVQGATIMGCDYGGLIGGDCNRVPYYSDPNLTYEGQPLGKATTDPEAAYNVCAANQRRAQYEAIYPREVSLVPDVQITSPATTVTHRVGYPLNMVAEATTAGGSPISGQITWHSNRSTNLGSGASISPTFSDTGPLLVTARVTDGGKTAQHSVRVERVEGDVPDVNVDYPAQYQEISGNPYISGWATDESGVVSLEFKIDGVPVQLANFDDAVARAGVCGTYPYSEDPNCDNVGWRGQLDTTTLANGSHTLSVIATDPYGSKRTFNRSFQVLNTTTVTIAPLADATVYENAPWYNYGTSQTLAVRGSGTGKAAHTYIKFWFSGVTFPIQSAKLRMRTRAYDIPQVSVWHMASNSWTETGITWNNASTATNGGAITKYSLPANTWVDIDITPFITANGTYTFAMASVDAYGYWFSSRETSYPPSLVITY